MEIVHELNQLDFGGVERVIRNIIKFDKVNKHKILAYKDGNYRSELEKIGAEITVLGEKEMEYSADVIHIHSGGAKSNMAYNLNGQFPIVETIHSPVRSAVMNTEVNQRIGVCDFVASKNREAVSIKNGLDFEELETTKSEEEVRAELGIPKDIPVVGRLGRLGRDKGLEEWLLVCYKLQQSGLKFVPLVVGGEARNCKGYRGDLKLMAASLPVHNVVWVGNRTDIANMYQIMDAFLYPSPTEGFGLVLAEAMYCEVPVITYKNDVNNELFGGYCLMGETLDELANLTQEALLNPTYTDELIPLAHNWVVSEYQAERMSAEYQELYERCNKHFNSGRSVKEKHVVPA